MDVTVRLQNLRRQEHECTVSIIEGLIECHHSKAYVDLGYSKIWLFLVEYLNYSNAAASRRYKAMKCAMKFPVVLEMLREHRVSLTSLAKVEALLHEIDDPMALLDSIDGRGQAEVERAVAKARPVASRPRERVRRKFVQPGVKAVSENDLFTADSSDDDPPTSAAELAVAATPAEERVTLEFSVTAEEYAAFERARAIVSRKTGRVPSVEESFHELVAFYLSKKAPRKDADGRQRTTDDPASRAKASPQSRASRPSTPTPSSAKPTRRSRHVPVAAREQVFRRDRDRCTFVGPSGHRCDAVHDLQIDHIQPFALGGTHEPENLRVLCGAHNRRRAELGFGWG